MPGNNFSPPIALLSQFDARTWSATAVLKLTVGGVPQTVTLPTYGDGEGLFDDALDFLNGRGSRSAAGSEQTLEGLIDNGWTGGATTITADIDSNDKVFIRSSAEDFKIDAEADNAVLGFSTGGVGLGGGAAPYTYTATSDWQRGIQSDLTLRLTPSTGATFSVTATRIQSVVTWLRSQNEGDADETNDTGNLERLAQDATGLNDFRCGIDDDGHVWFAWGTGDITEVSFPSTTFRDRLGFSGNESIQSSGNIDTLTAAYPLPGCYVATRGLERLDISRFEAGSAVRLTSGTLAANHVATFTRYELEFIVEGPAYSTDLHQQFLDRFLRYVPRGYPVTLYQHWGDPRRALRSHEITSSVAAYGLLYTSEQNGYRGRLRLARSMDDTEEHQVRWETRIRQRAPIRMLLEARGD